MKAKMIVMLSAALAMGLSAAAGMTFKAGHPTFGTWDNRADGWGQIFTPNAGKIVPDGYAVPDTVYLMDWTYAKTDSKTNLPEPGETYLAVYSALQVAEMTDETLLGISVNSLNALNFAANDLMTWQFDALELDANTQYAMMFVQYNENDSLQIVKGAVRLTVGNQYTGGGWIRINEIANDWDGQFQATYAIVPEPATITLALLGSAGSLILRRRRAL
jgi:uncharacterized protein (TIGR03382 family)